MGAAEAAPRRSQTPIVAADQRPIDTIWTNRQIGQHARPRARPRLLAASMSTCAKSIASWSPTPEIQFASLGCTLGRRRQLHSACSCALFYRCPRRQLLPVPRRRTSRSLRCDESSARRGKAPLRDVDCLSSWLSIGSTTSEICDASSRPPLSRSAGRRHHRRRRRALGGLGSAKSTSPTVSLPIIWLLLPQWTRRTWQRQVQVPVGGRPLHDRYTTIT